MYTRERDLNDVFSKYGAIDDVQIVYDAQSGRSRGFAFVYYKNTEDAEVAKDRCNGIEIGGRNVRVDFSITQRAHTPTPGIYMGNVSGYETQSRPSRGYRGGGGGGRGFRDRDSYRDHGSSRRDRSPSPYHSREKKRYTIPFTIYFSSQTLLLIATQQYVLCN